MATQAEIQALIDEIQTNANYPATKMNPLLSSMLDFASAGQTQVFDGLVANDTTLADTTLVLEYGVNIIVTATDTDFACRLPIPVTGKRVIVINRSTRSISLFPSMAGGRINNYAIDAPAIIPPDGNAYDFICIENPLPGAWVWSPPAIGQYDSGEITTNTIPQRVYSSVAPNLVLENQGFYSANSFAVDGLNRPVLPLVLSNNPGPGSNDNFVAFKPSAGWNAIVKVKVYTNLAWYPFGSSNPQIGLTQGSGYSSYLPGTQTYVGQTPGFGFTVGNYNLNPAYAECDYQVAGLAPGTFLPIGTLTPNIGDAGTAWGELVMNTYNGSGSRVGTFYEGIDTNGNDYYFTQMVNFQINPFLNSISLTGFKFRFFIEFN